MRILGIDPGYARLGYAVVDYLDDCFTICDYGCIETSAKTPFPERLLVIFEALTALCERFEPTAVAIEELFFAQNTTTAIGVAEARGVAVLAGAIRHLPVYEYTPLQVKMAVVGYGNADKQQVQAMICHILRLRKAPKPDDAADALAVAICHAHSGNRPEFLAVGGYQ
ncbi:MAG: crossover junction endodeoxyribonuclease RuvC [Eubacteriales bacterium]|nr:crossover junction endodeoxyribonuclease RuvC [Eubacteriales bacterium]